MKLDEIIECYDKDLDQNDEAVLEFINENFDHPPGFHSNCQSCVHVDPDKICC
ncbi:MAG: hypothetical protein GY820_05785 [Gammaproteobacteria bacterium]|nr:hypothetical protein [Gammaproteobacteria bacterium]